VALYRPGPMESGMHDDYVRRKHGESKVEYPLPQLEPILKDGFKRFSFLLPAEAFLRKQLGGVRPKGWTDFDPK